jgi:hypothetical protein
VVSLTPSSALDASFRERPGISIFICDAVAKGITDLNLKYSIPVVFGVLTTNDLQQALDRAGGKHGNKGDEAAITAIKMAALGSELYIELDFDGLPPFDDIVN